MSRTHSKTTKEYAKPKKVSELPVRIRFAKGKHDGKSTTRILDGLSPVRVGSHWENIPMEVEVIVIPSRKRGYVEFYEAKHPEKGRFGLSFPKDAFYKDFRFIRNALPDEDFMGPVKFNE